MQAYVTVTYINQPKPGGKMGNIKTNELGTVFVWPNKLADFPGPGQYTIEYSETAPNQPGQGPFRRYENMIAAGGTIQRTAPPPPPSQQYQQPAQPAQAPLTYEPVKPTQEQHVSQACCIFVTGVIGRCFQGTGAIPDSASMAHMIHNLRTAFEAGMEDKKAPEEAFDFGAQSENPNPESWQ